MRALEQKAVGQGSFNLWTLMMGGAGKGAEGVLCWQQSTRHRRATLTIRG